MEYDTSTMGPVSSPNLSTQQLADISNNMGSTKDFGLVSVLVPAIISAISIATSAGIAARNRKFQKEQQQQQQDYESPIAQVERLKAAGLNPNLLASSVSSGSFGESPAPLPDMGEVIGSNVNQAFQGINAAINLTQQQQNIDMMNERIRQLRISNDFAEKSNPDRLRLIVANLLSADQTNNLRQFDLEFAKWFNGRDFYATLNYLDNNGQWQQHRFDFGGLSARQVLDGVSPVVYSNIRNDKVYQDYLNSIKNGDILGAQLYGMQIGNSRAVIARDYEASTHMAWGANMRPLDMIISFALRGILEKYGPKLMEWLDSF